MKTIALCVIATGKYPGLFLEQFAKSAEQFFLPDCSVKLHIFSDAEQTDRYAAGKLLLRHGMRGMILEEHTPCLTYCWHCIAHRPWPGSTLYRYHEMLKAADELAQYDYLFYSDVDMRFVANVGDEILGDGLTATLHPGFATRPRRDFTYENREASACYVPPRAGVHYYAGGFQGGRALEYLAAMQMMAAMIDADAANGIVPRWHDESAFNAYCVSNPPAVILPPTYCCPESWPMDGRKILALDKNHAEARRAVA